MKLCGRAIGGSEPLFFILGPCVIESRDHALRCAGILADIAAKTGALIIYKSSFDKANRSSLAGFRGPGPERGLEILAEVREKTGLPVLTDVHDIEQIRRAAEVVDVLQTPALLARQTDFICAAAATGLPVNIKKGQWMSGRDMHAVADKAVAALPDSGLDIGGPIMLCERGFALGYNNLVVDMRSLPVMAETGWPVVFDATHSVQLPGANGGSSGGEREFVPYLARAAVAAGVSGVFMETHDDPDNALCDGPNAWPISMMQSLVEQLIAIDAIAKEAIFCHRGPDQD